MVIRKVILFNRLHKKGTQESRQLGVNGCHPWERESPVVYTWFRTIYEQKLFQNNLVSVRVNKRTTDTDGSVMLSPQFINVVPGILGGSVFVNDRTGNVSYKRPGTRSPSYEITKGKEGTE